MSARDLTPVEDLSVIVGSGGGGGKGGGGSAPVPHEFSDTYKSIDVVSLIDLIGEGEIVGLVDGLRSVYFNKVPLQNIDGSYNFSGVSVQVRTGTVDQSIMDGFADVRTEVPVGTAVKQAYPVEVAITDTEVDTVRMKVGVPQLTYQDPSNGNLGGDSIQLKFQISNNGGSFVDAALGASGASISPDIFSGYSSVGGRFTYHTTYRTQQVVAYYRKARDSDPIPVYRTVSAYDTVDIAIQASVNGGAWTTVQSYRVQGIGTIDFTMPTNPSATYALRLYSGVVGAAPAASGFSGFVAQAIAGSGLTSASFSYLTGLSAQTQAHIADKITSSSQYEFALNLKQYGSGPWVVRTVRVSADSTEANRVNAFNLDSYTLVKNVRLNYPYCALVGVQADATQFSSVPARTYRMKLLIVPVPSNYDAVSRTYSGVWDGTFKMSWTNNPVWCWLDLVTHPRYGLGKYIDISLVDISSLYQAAQYCDALVPDGFGGTEPRFTINVQILDRKKALDLLAQLTSTINSIVLYMQGTLYLMQDAPADVSYVFGNTNVIDGAFQYESTDSRSRHTVARVTYVDMSNLGQTAVEYVEDPIAVARYGIQPLDITAFGVTSRGQAHRLGHMLLYTDAYQYESVSFTTGLEGAARNTRPGKVIAISDWTRAGERLTGRVLGVSGDLTQVTIDQDLTFEVGMTLITLSDQGGYQVQTVSAITGRTVALSAAFGYPVAQDSMYILTKTALQPEQWRVTSVKEGNQVGQYVVTAASHNPDKYDYVDFGATLDVPPTSALSLIPDVPSGLTATDWIYLSSSAIKTHLDVSWTAAQGASSYKLIYRIDGGNWITVQTTSLSYTFPDVLPGSWDFRLQAVSSLGATQPVYAELSYTVLGKNRPPQDVTSAGYALDPNFGVTLNWTPVPDVDVNLYELRAGASWDTAGVVTQIKGTSYPLGYVLSGTYLVKALDTSGNYSAHAATVTFSLPAIGAPTGLTASFDTSGGLVLKWDAMVGAFSADHYEVSATGLTTKLVSATTITLDPFWTTGAKTLSVTPVDLGGNRGTAATVSVTIGQAAAPAVTATLSGDSYVLSWGAVAGTLPTATYLIRDGGIEIARTSATSYGAKAAWSGNKTFTVEAVDIKGISGAQGSATLGVTVPKNPTLTASAVDDATLLSWNDCTQSLPIDHYEIRKGASWATAAQVTLLKTTSYYVGASSGTGTFWVGAYDVAGNLCASPSSVVASYLGAVAPTVAGAYSGQNLVLSWNAVAGSLSTLSYEIRKGSTWAGGTVVARASTVAYTLKVDWMGSQTFWIAAVDVLGNFGTPGSYAAAPGVPLNPTLTATVADDTVQLSWTDATNTLPLDHYELRKGTSWALGTVVTDTKATTYTVSASNGAGTFWIAGVDTAGNVSATPKSATVTFNGAAAPTVTAAFSGQNLNLSWNAVAGSLSTQSYEIRQGATWATGAVVAKIKSTAYSLKATWSGTQSFWVAAVDVLGNYGSAGSVGATVNVPTNPTLSYQIKDDTVQLLWTSAATTLPIDHYEIRKGSTWAGGTLVAASNTTAYTVSASNGAGTFWVGAFDSAGNVSAAPSSVTVSFTAAGAPTVSGAYSGQNLVLSWSAVAGSLSTALYEVRRGATWAGATSLGTIKGTSFSVKVDWSGSQTYWVAAIDILGTYGTTGSYVATVGAPATPTLTSAISSDQVVLSWTDATASLPIDHYEIRQGASWATASVVASSKTTKYTLPASSGAGTFWVAGVDTSGTYSTTPGSVTVAFSAAAAPTVSGSFSGSSLNLSWGAVAGTLSTDHYEVRQGSTWATATPVASLKSLSTAVKASWSGPQTFLVAAVDILGNVGAAGAYTATVSTPTAPAVTQQVIDNNVLLSWTDATATLPLDHFEVRKGAIWATASLVGPISSRFTVVFESSSGTYTYWVCGVDSAGNYGTPASVSAYVNQPPDYVLQYNHDSTFNGTLSNMVAEADASGYVLPVDTAASWATHFTGHSWTSPQDQINAGYPLFIQPNANVAGYYEETIDYGTVLAATKLTMTPTYQVLAGSPTITPMISVKLNSTDAWTDYNNVSSAYVSNFRYAKFRFTVTPAAIGDTVKLTAMNMRFDVKLKNDAGMITANASDTNGTQVNFNVSFVDVNSITVSPGTTAAAYAIYNFVDVPNPTSFTVYLYDKNGNRVSGSVSWSAKGV